MMTLYGNNFNQNYDHDVQHHDHQVQRGQWTPCSSKASHTVWGSRPSSSSPSAHRSPRDDEEQEYVDDDDDADDDDDDDDVAKQQIINNSTCKTLRRSDEFEGGSGEDGNGLFPGTSTLKSPSF